MQGQTPVLIHKVVQSIPVDLEANAIYFVRKGDGFEIKVVDATAQIAYGLDNTMNEAQFNELKQGLTSIQTAISNIGTGGNTNNPDLLITQPVSITLNELTTDKYDDLYEITGSIANLRSTDVVKYALKHDFMSEIDTRFNLLELDEMHAFTRVGNVVEELEGSFQGYEDILSDMFFQFIVKVWDHSGNVMAERSVEIKYPNWD